MILHFLVTVGGFLLFLFLIKTLILLSDVFNELDDGLIMEIIDAIFDLVIMNKGIVVLEERLKQLRDTVFDSSFFQNFAENKLSDELNVTENALLGFFQEGLFVLWRFKLREFVYLLVKGMLNRLNEEELERIVFFCCSLKLEFRRRFL